MPEGSAIIRIGRYALYQAVASGGMATVHIGRMRSAAGVSRTVAVKRVHPHFASDPDFASMFFDEARLSLRIQHPNVVPTFDVVAEGGELLLVMDYVHGDSLSSLVREVQRRGQLIPPRIVSGIVAGFLAGLHAAHELKGEDGLPLGIVHRDVSPQNILVGVDGSARVLDFGVAKAAGRLHSTEQGKVKGKIAYMAPEQLVAGPLDQRADVFAAAIVLWEALTGRRLFNADGPGAVAIAVLSSDILPPSMVNPALDPAIDAVVMKGLSRHVAARYASAEEMAIELERVLPPATARAIGDWVEEVASDKLAVRAQLVLDVESDGSAQVPLRRAREERTISGVDEVPSEGVDAGGAPVTAEPQLASLVSATVTTDPQEPPFKPARSPLVVGAVLALVGVGALAVAFRAGLGAAPAGAASVAATVESGVRSAVPASSAEPATSAPTPLPDASVDEHPPPSPPPIPTHLAPRDWPRAPVPKPLPPKPPVAKPALDCTNPFFVDSHGIRVPRPECF